MNACMVRIIYVDILIMAWTSFANFHTAIMCFHSHKIVSCKVMPFSQHPNFTWNWVPMFNAMHSYHPPFHEDLKHPLFSKSMDHATSPWYRHRVWVPSYEDGVPGPFLPTASVVEVIKMVLYFRSSVSRVNITAAHFIAHIHSTSVCIRYEH